MFNTFSTFILVAVATLATAQEQPIEPMASMKEEARETRMETRQHALDAAGLDTDQLSEVNAILASHEQRAAALRNNEELAPQARRRAMGVSRKQTANQLKDVMTANQWERFSKMMKTERPGDDRRFRKARRNKRMAQVFRNRRN